MNKNFKYLLIASGLATALTACSSGSSSSNNGGGEINNNKKSSATNLQTNPTMGVGQILCTTTTDANNVTPYHYNTIVAGF